ncbi:hypothetical protein VNI85_22290 [Klebsiella variicola]|uniref:hypothetical protein n=1 Tax=Klebsiella variicola TaxID=244366 RepID=UPI0027F2BF63|nr:hypothetical protein [Klebsiella variicola]EMA4731520.1 hypothetical protein [Klebsiella variicola]WRS00850.1 hypothetical protein VNI85_22290 [Klebsiella variicola]
MNIEAFIAAGKAAFGNHFVTEMAERLSVSDRTVRHWVTGKYALPSTIGADVQRVLHSRITEINEALKMTTEKFLMNPFTGSVDTEENWLAEMPTWDEDLAECKRQFDTLVEVVKNEDGDWVEA